MTTFQRKTSSQSKSKNTGVRTQLVVNENDEEMMERPGPSVNTVSTQEDSDDDSSAGYSDSEENAMHNLINHQPHNTNVSPDKSLLSPTSLVNMADDIFCQDYVTEDPVKHLPPVSLTLAEKITQWCRSPPTKDEVKEMFRNTSVPINVEGLQPVRINEMLYRKLPFKARVNDQRLRGINTFLARGCGPLVAVFQELCTLEAAFKSSTDKTVVKIHSDGKFLLDQMLVDVNYLRKKLGDSLRLLTACHSNILIRRKLGLRPFLDRKFHHLTKDSNTITNNLLGMI